MGRPFVAASNAKMWASSFIHFNPSLFIHHGPGQLVLAILRGEGLVEGGSKTSLLASVCHSSLMTYPSSMKVQALSSSSFWSPSGAAV